MNDSTVAHSQKCVVVPMSSGVLTSLVRVNSRQLQLYLVTAECESALSLPLVVI